MLVSPPIRQGGDADTGDIEQLSQSAGQRHIGHSDRDIDHASFCCRYVECEALYLHVGLYRQGGDENQARDLATRERGNGTAALAALSERLKGQLPGEAFRPYQQANQGDRVVVCRDDGLDT